MSALPTTSLTPEEYMEVERQSESRNEYYRGHMYAMAGASPDHVFIVFNFGVEIGIALRGSACRAGASDLRVRVSPEGLYTYPDIVVCCGEPLFADDRKDTLVNPSLIVEVLSPATESRDRGFKFVQYRKLESLREYVLVSQEEPRVEIFRPRAERSEWVLIEATGLDAVCRLESIGAEIPLREIYSGIAFDET